MSCYKLNLTKKLIVYKQNKHLFLIPSVSVITKYMFTWQLSQNKLHILKFEKMDSYLFKTRFGKYTAEKEDMDIPFQLTENIPFQ